MTHVDEAQTASARVQQAAEQYIPGGVSSSRRRQSPPLAVARASGAYLEDVDGRRFIDYTAGAGTVILGYSYPAVVERVAAVIQDRVLFAIGTTELEAQLGRKIVEHVPSVEQILPCNSGSEATLNAIRLARAVTGRQRILKFQGCYHGFHDYVLMNVASDADRVNGRDPGSAGMLDAAVDSTVVCPYNDLDAVEAAFREHADEIAAVIVEPVAHNTPTILPADGFLEGLRDITARMGALLVFDEVITGFRHAIGGYQSICGVMPDLTVMGKAIANGFTIAVLGGREELMSRFNTHPDGDVVWAGTYNGSQVGVSAALATIECLESEDVYAHIFRLGERMRGGLEEVTRAASVPAVACGYGSVFALCFMEGPVTRYEDFLRNDVELTVRYRRELMRLGSLEIPDAKNMRSHITYSHTDDDVDRTLEMAQKALAVALRSRPTGLFA